MARNEIYKMMFGKNTGECDAIEEIAIEQAKEPGIDSQQPPAQHGWSIGFL